MPTRTLQNELGTVNLRKSFPEYIELRKKDKLTLLMIKIEEDF